MTPYPPSRDDRTLTMEQTPAGAQRPAAHVPWKVGVTGPEAARRTRRGPACSGSEGAWLAKQPGRLWGARIPFTAFDIGSIWLRGSISREGKAIQTRQVSAPGLVGSRRTVRQAIIHQWSKLGTPNRITF